MNPTSASPASGTGSRFRAAFASFSLDGKIRAARKREKKFMTDAGTDIVASMPLVDLPQADAQALRDRIGDIVLEMNALDLALRGSLEKDRQDYAKASQLMRWIVVGRGLLDRWILKDRVRFHLRERARLSHELGALAFDGTHDPLLNDVPAPIREGVVKARADIAAARSERAKLLAPWNGEPLPPWLATAVRETRAFFRHIWEHLSKRLFLRAPAIAALIVAWWIANHYTASFTERLRHSMGFGGRAPMDPGTLAQIKFIAPILAAALCSYLMSLVAVHVQRKYATPGKTE
jgi:hypothetical protein